MKIIPYVLGGLFGTTILGAAYALTSSKRPALPRNTPQPKNYGVPFAEPYGEDWPVLGRAKAVAYTDVAGKVHGNGATFFHATREGAKRYHAGVDLPCFPGDHVVAMEDGIVLGNAPGYVKLDAVVVQHSHCVVVYAEVALGSMKKAGLSVGSHVDAGQVIAFGAENYSGNSMLHVETWALGHAPKFYTPWYVGNKPPVGLLDPTLYLLALSEA